MKLKVNSACAPSERLDYFKPSVSFEDLKEKYHFEKRVIDLIEVPEPLLCFFCKYHHLQDLPIAGNLGPAVIQRVGMIGGGEGGPFLSSNPFQCHLVLLPR